MKTFFKFYAFSALIMVLIFSSNLSYAASQGSLGLTSQGSATISVTKSVQARITDIQDMTLSNWSVGDPAVTLYSNVCVYSSTGGYKVTATGSGTGNDFTISNGGTPIIYSVAWSDAGVGNINVTSGTTLLTGVPSTTFANASTSSSNCSGGGLSNDTARVIVNIAQLAMDVAPSSNTAYTGTLTMLITPF